MDGGIRKIRGTAAVAVVLVATLGWLASGSPGPVGATESPATDGTAAPSRRPNIIVIMTDDQTVESLRVMPEVKRYLVDDGIEFENNIVSWSLCCPSRVTYLTGQYAHNHGVRGNVPPEGGYAAFKNQETTFPAALQNAGYDTIHIGKYVNNYGQSKPVVVPPGWSEWHGSVDPSTYRYQGYTLLENGKEKTYAKKRSNYQTDRYSNIASSVIRKRSGSDQPFFLNLAYLAPHAQVGAAAEVDYEDLHLAVPAPRHRGTLADEKLEKSASFNEADVSDKPEFVKQLPRIDKERQAKLQASYQIFLESLLAVDDGVKKIVRTLEDTGQLDNTVIIYTSDNGFFFGEHRIYTGKGRFYEPSIRVPLIIRGPGFEPGERPNLTANIDLAPTVLQLAGATPLRPPDGVSLVPLLQGPQPVADRSVLLEEGSVWVPSFGVRTPRYKYTYLSSQEHELYDLEQDPDELDNRYGDPALAAVQADLEARRARLAACAGANCARDSAG